MSYTNPGVHSRIHVDFSLSVCFPKHDRNLALETRLAQRARPFAFQFSATEDLPMSHETMKSCTDACNDCAAACNHCASECLQEQNVRDMARCIALDIDCAEICRTAAAFMSRGSELATIVCGACCDVCEACAEECAQHQMDHCQACAEACRRCADECRRMATQGNATRSRTSSQSAR